MSWIFLQFGQWLVKNLAWLFQDVVPQQQETQTALVRNFNNVLETRSRDILQAKCGLERLSQELLPWMFLTKLRSNNYIDDSSWKPFKGKGEAF